MRGREGGGRGGGRERGREGEGSKGEEKARMRNITMTQQSKPQSLPLVFLISPTILQSLFLPLYLPLPLPLPLPPLLLLSPAELAVGMLEQLVPRQLEKPVKQVLFKF